MPDDFYLDPAALASEIAALRTTGNALSTAFTALTGVLEDHHGCWGTDDVGEAFAKNYVGSEREFTTNGRATVDGLGAAADGIEESSEVFQSVDRDNAERIDRSGS